MEPRRHLKGLHKEKIVDKRGDVYVYRPNHARALNTGYVLEHIVIAETAHGGPLPPTAVIHHHDRVRSNNANNNLVICQDQAYHLLLHMRLRALENCGHADWRKCPICKVYTDPVQLVKVNGQGDLGHLACRQLAQRESYRRRAKSSHMEELA